MISQTLLDEALQAKLAVERVAGHTFEEWMKDHRPGNVAAAAEVFFGRSDYVEAVKLYDRAKEIEGEDPGWRQGYPTYCAALILSGEKTRGRQELQNMLQSAKNGEHPYHTQELRRELLGCLDNARDKLNGDDRDFTQGIIDQLENFQDKQPTQKQ